MKTWRLRRRHALMALAATATASPALAAGHVANDGSVKSSIWSFGVTADRQNLKAGDNNEIIGTSAALQIGTGYISRAWFLDISADILQGPYGPTHNQQLVVDYTGYGTTIWAGFSAQDADLRSKDGGYGFALGLSYAALTGQMDGRNRNDNGQNTYSDRQLINTYTIHVSNLSILPAVFFSWFAPARPEGNTPELLLTRVEGYVLLIGTAAPLVATYNTTYTYGNGDAGRGHGNFSGYSIFVNLTAMLGS